MKEKIDKAEKLRRAQAAIDAAYRKFGRYRSTSNREALRRAMSRFSKVKRECE